MLEWRQIVTRVALRVVGHTRANRPDSGRTDPQGETRRRISREQGGRIGRGSVSGSMVWVSYVRVIDRAQARGETLEPGSAL